MTKSIQLFLFVIAMTAFAATSIADSPEIRRLLEKQKEVTHETEEHVDILTELSSQYLYINLSVAINYANTAFHEADRINYPLGEARARQVLATAYYIESDDAQAMAQYSRAYTIMDSLKANEKQALAAEVGLGGISEGIARVYNHLGNDDKALDYYRRSLKIREKLNNFQGKASLLHKIALIHYRREEYTIATTELRIAVKLLDSLNSQEGLAEILNSLGECYNAQQQYNLAIYEHEKAKKISEANGDYSSLAYSTMKIAENQLQQGQFDGLQKALQEALNYAKKANNSYLETHAMLITGRYYLAIENTKMAKLYANEVINISTEKYEKSGESAFLQELVEAHEILFKIAAINGDYEKVLIHQAQLVQYKDTIFKLEKRSIIQTLRLNQILERKDEELIRKENEKARYKKITELQEQSMERLITFAGVVVLIITAAMILQIRANYSNRQLNRELKEKNLEIRERSEELNNKYDLIREQNNNLSIANKKAGLQNQVMIDGIKSAKDIQDNLLPSDEYLDQLFPQHFLIYLPKEMVSGDFYWANDINGKKIIAIADCTGHGVSGALTSMFGINFMNQAVDEMGIHDPGEILKVLQKGFQNNIAHSKIRSAIGMEIGICTIDEEARSIKFAGIRTYVYYCKGNGDLIELKGDRHPVSRAKDAKIHPYQSIEITYEKDEQVMIFFSTDGYKDQYGGIHDRQRFSRRRMRDLLREIRLYGPEHQRRELVNNLNNWMGGTEIQTDDILIFGLRLNSQKIAYKDEMKDHVVKIPKTIT